MVVRRGSTRSECPLRIFSASAAWSAPIAAVTGPSTPAVSHVGCTPPGGSGIMHRRQQVLPGKMVMVESIAAHRGSIYPRDAALDGEIIDEVTRFEIIRGVHDQADAVEEILDVARRHIRNLGLDLNAGVDGLQATGGGDGFRTDLARILLVIEQLPLEVREFHVIAVDDTERTDSRAGQKFGLNGAERAAPDHSHTGRTDEILPLFADFPKPQLPGIPFAICVRVIRYRSVHE